jgi:Ca2+-transporting ATPase
MLGEISDSVIIGVVVFINAFVGMLQEGKARKALESLKKLTSPHASVIRDGVKKLIPASELVAGDIVCLDAGCLVPADMRLIMTENLKIEESALTGETFPVEKAADYVCGGEAESETPLGDRINMAYMSSMVTYGRGEGVVTATGMNTEMGKIAAMITEAKEEQTPLQKRLGELGSILSVLSLGLCALLFIIAVLQKRNIFDMLLTAISLAVAAVPEGLPAVVTICLALSVTRMVKVNTIIRKLPSVETLGAVSVVCSDKTGTLTENKMSVEKYWLDGELHEGRKVADAGKCEDFLRAMVLCNDASVQEDSRVGDPTELALLDFALENGIYKENLERQYIRESEIPFDSDRKLMTTIHRVAGRSCGSISYTKGAPDEIIKRCSYIKINGKSRALTEKDKKDIQSALNEMSAGALRILAAAMNMEKSPEPEKNMIFLGLTGMKDPVRAGVAEAVNTFKDAGVRTVMITGDHADTALAIGKQLGFADNMSQCMTGAQMSMLGDKEFGRRIKDIRIFARVSPAQKCRIVDGFKRNGEIVAMTGDGVNDAPSLKAADIGIAMGVTGTDVAKQAADMILTDDNFATIEKAIEEGRAVYENIRKSVIFLLSSNLGEILTMFVAVVCGMAPPLKSSHILWINLITDSLPALALGVDVNDKKQLMKNKPRKADESLFARGGFMCTCFYGILIAAISIAAFLLLPVAWLESQGADISVGNLAIMLRQGDILEHSQTYAFTVLGMSQLFHAVGMRDMHTSVFKMKHLENKLMIVAFVTGFLMQLAVTVVPFLTGAFGTAALSWKEWGMLTVLAAFPMFAHEIIVIVGKENKRA